MALRWPSGVPVTDVSLVLGDTVPVRIRVEHALDNCTPALAVKQTIGSPDLIMTVTGFVVKMTGRRLTGWSIRRRSRRRLTVRTAWPWWPRWCWWPLMERNTRLARSG